jgi:spermidine/putrescine transport system substrate-binding protein
MFSDLRDGLGLVLLSQGKSPADATAEDIQAAADRVAEAKDAGQIRRFTGNDYLDDLAAGNTAVCQCYSGDVAQLVLDNPDLEFVVPEEGMLLFSDNMVMPLSTANSTGAEQWMDYIYDPVNMARITAYVQYIPPVEGTGDELARIDPALAENPLINPPASSTDVAVVWRPLTDEEDQEFTSLYAEVTEG